MYDSMVNVWHSVVLNMWTSMSHAQRHIIITNKWLEHYMRFGVTVTSQWHTKLHTIV